MQTSGMAGMGRSGTILLNGPDASGSDWPGRSFDQAMRSVGPMPGGLGEVVSRGGVKQTRAAGSVVSLPAISLKNTDARDNVGTE